VGFINSIRKKIAVLLILLIAFSTAGVANAQSTDFEVTIDGERIAGFLPSVHSYDISFDADVTSFDMDVFCNESITVHGDIGNNRIYYGLNKFNITVVEKKHETVFVIYAIRAYPDGFKVTNQRIVDYANFQNDSTVEIVIDEMGIDFDILEPVSVSEDMRVLKKDDGKVHIKIDAKDFKQQPFEMILRQKEGYVTVSKQVIDQLENQRRMIVVLAALQLALLAFFFIYFFNLKRKKTDEDNPSALK
jgi:hypothetical protein